MRTVVFIPDELFAHAERLARELRTSRSRLYANAVREYLARHSVGEVTEALDRVCDELVEVDDPPRDGEFVRAAARRSLRGAER